MTMQPQAENPIRVSFVMPAYKVADTIEKAVDSALAQTERNIEMIIVDDCSPDNTLEVAESIAARDPRVRVLRMPKNGARSGAVNFGMKHARGEWIAILDGDDWIAPERTERLLAAAEAEKGIDMVTDNQIFIDLMANAQTGTAFPQLGRKRIFDLDRFLAGSDPTSRFDYGMLKQMYRTQFTREHDVEYYEPARTGEDFYGLLCFFAAGGKALVLDDAYYYYVQPFGTISREGSVPGRKRYNFELLIDINNHFIERYRNQFTKAQLQRLIDRGHGFEALACFHQIRECLQDKDAMGAVKRTLKAPLAFWKLLADRVAGRIRLMRMPKDRIAHMAHFTREV